MDRLLKILTPKLRDISTYTPDARMKARISTHFHEKRFMFPFEFIARRKKKITTDSHHKKHILFYIITNHTAGEHSGYSYFHTPSTDPKSQLFARAASICISLSRKTLKTTVFGLLGLILRTRRVRK